MWCCSEPEFEKLHADDLDRSDYFSATAKDGNLEEQGTIMAGGIARELLKE